MRMLTAAVVYAVPSLSAVAAPWMHLALRGRDLMQRYLWR
jgi:hypothetical protein